MCLQSLDMSENAQTIFPSEVQVIFGYGVMKNARVTKIKELLQDTAYNHSHDQRAIVSD